MGLKNYLEAIHSQYARGDSREESYYPNLKNLIDAIAVKLGKKNIHVTTLPKQTEAGNPDFKIWDGKQHHVGYIEAKKPETHNLNDVEESEQLGRYRYTFPNMILTNFFEFRLYRNGEIIKTVSIGRSFVSTKLKTAPPPENENLFLELMEIFLGFSTPKAYNAEQLAVELKKYQEPFAKISC
ncbi:MAG: adenine methyltransferase [Nitrospinae bacterium]|nr:adenine methyltransferase [Nitrospinota bacterium]